MIPNMRTEPWNLKQLYLAMKEDLENCETDFERTMCKAVCLKEIRQKGIEYAEIRKLTPGEASILRAIENGEI